MNLGIAIEFIILSGLLGTGLGVTVCVVRSERQRKAAKAKAKASQARVWEVQTEARSGYVTTDKDGKQIGGKHDVVAVFCAKRADDDDLRSRRTSKVDIGAYDARKDDLTEGVARLIEQAEARCTDLNALDVK